MSEEYDYSSLRPDELLARMAGLAVLQKRIDTALKAMKAEYQRDHDADAPGENARFGGLDAATVSVSKDGEGRYMVDDPLAYADFLAHYGFDCEGQPAYHTVNYPTVTAMGEAYLDRLIRGHGGAIPDGVSWHAGRKGTVTIRLNKGVAERAFDRTLLADTVMDAIEPAASVTVAA
ncbi:hypothetical protein [Bifidobacterium sp. SO1]|uniref:hypothetical protein n=1 Tax=Bifidobacterium sp. SO1 TaxID=2809029 RepID=UPI001F0AA9CC|nr:hypothetical protein [Bifidobacterium sp. SO1]